MKKLPLILATLLASLVPLFPPVGRNLEYEYALLAGWLSLCFIPLTGMFWPLSWQKNPSLPGHTLDFFWVFLGAPLVLGTTGGILFTLKVCPCSPNGFAFWMFLLAYPSLILAQAIYFAVLRARVAGIHRGLIFAIFVTCLLSFVLYTGTELWFNPQKRFDHMALGFLHGPIYDYWIPVDLGIILERAAAINFAASLVFLSWVRKDWLLLLSIFLSLLTGVTFQTLANSYPSTSNSMASLKETLSKSIKGQGFTLYYRPQQHQENSSEKPEENPSKIYEKKIKTLFIDAQFHLTELTKILKGSETLPHVEVFVYPSEDEKKLWFGGGATDVTDVYTPSIHITLEGFPHPTLRHELVHALASGFGFHGLGFHPNIAFTEGLAIALAPSPSDISLDEGAASLLESGRIGDVKTLFSPLFWQQSSSRAYTVAGSLILYLIDKYGINAVKSLYSGASFASAFSQDENEVINKWKQKILSSYDKKTVGIYTESLYRQGGLFQEKCPHTVKDYERASSDGVLSRLRQPLYHDPERDYLPWLVSLKPDSLAVKQRLWRREILSLGRERVLKGDKLMSWVKTLRSSRKTPPESIEDIELAIQESDILYLVGQKEESERLLAEIQSFAEKKNIGENLSRFVMVRSLIAKESFHSQDEWRKYLARFRLDIPDKMPHIDGPWIHLYLKLRSKDPQVEFTTDQLSNLVHSNLAPPSGTAQSFEREFYSVLGGRLMELGQFSLAAQAYQKAAQVARSLTQSHLLELKRRAEFHAQFRG